VGLHVANRQAQVLVRAAVDDEVLVACLQRAESLGQLLGLHFAEVDVVDDGEATFLDEQAQRALQRGDANATRRTVAPVLRLGRMSTTATDVDRRADGTVTRTAGALLLVELLAGALDRGALFAGTGAGATGRE